MEQVLPYYSRKFLLIFQFESLRIKREKKYLLKNNKRFGERFEFQQIFIQETSPVLV